MTTTVAVAGASGSFGALPRVVSNADIYGVEYRNGNPDHHATCGQRNRISVSGMTLPASVNAGKSATFSREVRAEAAGAATGSVSMTGNTNPSVSTIALSGTGIGRGPVCDHCFSFEL